MPMQPPTTAPVTITVGWLLFTISTVACCPPPKMLLCWCWLLAIATGLLSLDTLNTIVHCMVTAAATPPPLKQSPLPALLVLDWLVFYHHSWLFFIVKPEHLLASKDAATLPQLCLQCHWLCMSAGWCRLLCSCLQLCFTFTPDAIALCTAITAAMPLLLHCNTVATDYELPCNQLGDGD